MSLRICDTAASNKVVLPVFQASCRSAYRKNSCSDSCPLVSLACGGKGPLSRLPPASLASPLPKDLEPSLHCCSHRAQFQRLGGRSIATLRAITDHYISSCPE
jgi:hypothetical protein